MDESLNSQPQRRTYSPQFKAELVAQCLEGHTSLTALAVDHGMNPNVLHRWVTEHARYGKHSLQSVQPTPDDQTIDITPANWVALKPAQAVQAPKVNNAKATATPSRSTGSDTVVELELSARGLTMKVHQAILTHDVLHADETPVQVLRPETGKKTHRAYLWVYAPGAFEDLKAVVYDFAPSRAGEHARAFLGSWQGNLVTDDYTGYKKTFQEQGVTEIGCMAHARRKFFELHANNQSQIAEQALQYFGQLYDIERETKTLTPQERRRIRQTHAKPVIDQLHAWLLAQRLRVPDGFGQTPVRS